MSGNRKFLTMRGEMEPHSAAMHPLHCPSKEPPVYEIALMCSCPLDHSLYGDFVLPPNPFYLFTSH